MRAEKQLLLDEIKEQINESPSFVIMSYQGLTANLANDLRNKVANVGGNVEVLGKRILLKAASEQGISLDLEQLVGHIGVVFTGEDAVTTTKAVYQFSKDNGDILKVIAGRFDSKIYSAEDVKKLSELPGKDEMRAQFLGLLEAPMSQTLSTMEALVCSVIYCLSNKVKAQEGCES